MALELMSKVAPFEVKHKPGYRQVTFFRFLSVLLSRARTSEAKDCRQNANALRPYLDIGMIERSWLFSETTLR
jgi:hypothetical protein